MKKRHFRLMRRQSDVTQLLLGRRKDWKCRTNIVYEFTHKWHRL